MSDRWTTLWLSPGLHTLSVAFIERSIWFGVLIAGITNCGTQLYVEFPGAGEIYAVRRDAGGVYHRV